MKSLKIEILSDDSDLVRYHHAEHYEAYLMREKVDEKIYTNVGWMIWGVMNETFNSS